MAVVKGLAPWKPKTETLQIERERDLREEALQIVIRRNAA